MADPWQRHSPAGLLSGLGPDGLLDAQPTAFFASRSCSGAAIRAAMDWAVARVRARQTVVSGFHSPVEQSAGHLVVLSAQGTGQPVGKRLTAASAKARNDVAARIASRIVIPQASVGGQLADQAAVWQEEGLHLDNLIQS